jgi:hypothetical protein
MLLKSISESNKMPQLKGDGARLTYTWLLAHVDVNGCFSGDAKVIRGKIVTRLEKSIKTIESYLQDMEKLELIFRYTADSDVFLIVPDFIEKQPKLNPDRETPATIPLPTLEQIRNLSDITQERIKHNINEIKLREDKSS